MQAQSEVTLPEPNSESAERSGVFGPVMSSLGWPLVIGLVAYWAFLFFIEKEWIASETLVRYLSAHPVSYVATGMFFVGMAGLALKLFNVLAQIVDRKNVTLSPVPALAQRPEASRHLLEEIDEMPLGRQESYLGQRLRDALEFVDKTESANGLEDELKYLAETDLEKQQESFALTRILIWAIPMLGFLGTVIGISGALGGLSVESDFNVMLSGLKDKLYVAFDTTALALTLSIVLMFAQFIVNKVETQLLESVDEAAAEELTGRFVTYGTSRDPYLASVESMSNQVLEGISEISAQQAAVWDRGLSSIQKTTEQTLCMFAEVLADRLAKQLDPVLDEFGISVRAAIKDTTQYLDHHNQKLAEAMKASVGVMDQHNQNLADSMHNSMGVMDQRNEAITETLQSFSHEFKNVVASHTESLKETMSGSEDVLNSHLQQVHQIMKQTIDLVAGQSQQLQAGIENSRSLVDASSDNIQKAVESANQYMERHTDQLNEVVLASSQLMEEHARRIGDALVQSEAMVDKRQQTIAQTQDSMLKAQTQQSMAISSFTEKLQTLQDVVDQSNSLQRMQSTLNETISNLERSDTIAQEIKGLARLIKDQIKYVDQQQLSQAQASEKQLVAVIQQTEKVFDQNSTLLSEYQRKTDELVKVVVSATEKSLSSKNQNLDEHFQSLSQQLVTQNQTLATVGKQLQESLRFDDLSAQLTVILERLLKESDQTSALAPQLESIVQKLEDVQTAFQKPAPHQQQFLTQQKQTIDNQNQLLDFCQTLEVNNRSTFLDTAQQILESHSESATKAVKLEQTVRELSFSINLLNQSLASQNSKAAEDTLQFNQPDIPKRVA